MKAVKLFGPKDLQLVDEPGPGSVGRGEVLIKVGAVGICGSDLHMYGTGAIGNTKIESSFTLGHEFMGEVLEVGEGSDNGMHELLVRGQRVVRALSQAERFRHQRAPLPPARQRGRPLRQLSYAIA